jgi:multidrug efflux pump subunit AcrA (membrane-fusion protein)
MMRTRGLVVAVLLCGVCGGCGHATDDDAKGADKQAAVVGARTARATEGPFTVAITAIGTVAPRPGHYAEMSAPAPTRVARIFVAPGDAV